MRVKKYRENLSEAKEQEIYQQQYEYKTRVWLKKENNNIQMNTDYCRETRVRRNNFNSFEAGTSAK